MPCVAVWRRMLRLAAHRTTGEKAEMQQHTTPSSPQRAPYATL